ncbi:MAG: 3-phosphoshikimate 1-carboxyvinyltransferase [Thermoguttaceae bacterium]|jgi:3-phosphoshikimate 1-carboxyvinyltransferase
MIDSIEIQPTGPLRARIRPPGSKSITNRALVCAALARGESLLTGALESDDTRVMIEGLRQFGLALDHDPNARTIRVTGCGGRPPAASADLLLGNSGTTVRFLTALATLGHGVYRLDGTSRMRERPIQDLLDALRHLGADAVSEAGTGCPPVVVRAAGLRGGRAEVAGNISSQFLSAVLQVAPCAASDIVLAIRGELVSKPYVAMTLAVMRAFGVGISADDFPLRVPAPQPYLGRTYAIEPDASAASYFFAAAAIAGGSVTVEGLSRDSLQGDVAFCHCLQQMGCEVIFADDQITVKGGPLRGIDVDMNAVSDTVQTLSAAALFADGPTTIRNVEHIRHKETDRIAALATELRKFGAEIDERADGLRITPKLVHGAAIDTYDDHRMAMSMALVGLAVPGVVIRDPRCTSKTYPEFFRDLSALERER